MRKVFLIVPALLLTAFAAVPGEPKFYPDDPIWAVPAPLPVEEADERDMSDIYDYFLYTFATPQETHKKSASGLIRAQATNTLDEVPDSQWFTNRIGIKEMSIEDLKRGPGNERPPSKDGAWTVVSAKTEGLTPGFMIEDATGERYLLKFDPMTNPEMASGADILGSRFFHALGYWAPQNYIVYFTADRLEIGGDTTVDDPVRGERPMVDADIAPILERVPQRPDGTIRALASRLLKGKPLGGFRYHGTRSDDPNDVVLHEHRRDLRGLYVFASWLGHDDSRGINTLDMLVEEDGKKFFRHHLIDFGSILGSASEEPNSPRGGNQYLYDTEMMIKEIFSLGLYVPRWYRWDYEEHPSIGRFEHAFYEPDQWRPEYKNPAFENRLPDDTFWGAKKVMEFSDEEIAAIVSVAEYSDPEAEAWLVECLIKRRDKIGREYFSRVLPLDRFAIEDGGLVYENLAARHGFSEAQRITVSWSRYDNRTDTLTEIGGSGTALPEAVRSAADGQYYMARFVGDDPDKTVHVYVRTGSTPEVVGVERYW